MTHRVAPVGLALSMALALTVALAVACALQSRAHASVPQTQGIGYSSKLGAPLDMAASLRDEQGRLVTLRALLAGRPALLVLGYFHCPNLCSVVRVDLLRAASQSGLVPGVDYAVIALSIDPRETPADARAARDADTAALALGAAAAGRYYLTGEATAIEAVADSVGFASRYERTSDQYLHPPGVVVTTATGIISSYLSGVGYSAVAVRDAVRRAGRNTVAAAFAPLALLCFSYDEHSGRYSFAILKALRLGSLLMVLIVLGALIVAHRRRRLHP